MQCKSILGVAIVFALLAPAGAEEKAAKLDPAKLVGNWTFVSGERDGKKIDADQLKKGSVEITKDTIILNGDQGKFLMKYTLDTKKTPCGIEMEITEGPQGQGAKTSGIIALDGDQLKLCYSAMGGDTPKEFSAKESSGNHLFVLKKKK
jgi:uncharacterized protein (TIGR03067 family)